MITKVMLKLSVNQVFMTENKILTKEQIIEGIFLDIRYKAITFISNSIPWDNTQEDVEDIFVDSVARLYDLLPDEKYDYTRAQKQFYGIIKKKIILHKRRKMNEISIDVLLVRRTGNFDNSDNNHEAEDFIKPAGVLLYSPEELYDKERAKTPERKAQVRKYHKKIYYEIKEDPIKYQEYKDKRNTTRNRMRAEKKAGTWKDRRLIKNQDS